MANSTKKRDWTDEQKDAMKPCKENLLVSAAAGSGKTAVMIQRIVNLLLQGEDLSRMLICTFTKAAAAEMKRKLIDAIDEYGDNACLAAAKKKLPLAEICTLDAWCAHVIKNRFFISDLSPDFTVLDDGEEEALKTEVCERLIEEECSGGDVTFAELYDALLAGRSHERLRKAILKVYDYAIAQPDPARWIDLTASYSDDEYRQMLWEPLKKETDELIAEAKSLLCDISAAGFELDRDRLTQVIAAMEEYAENTVNNRGGSVEPEFKELHADYLSVANRYKELYEKKVKIFSSEQMPSHEGSDCYCRKLGELALKLWAEYGEVKRTRGKADYSDLEHQALKILNDPVYGKEVIAEYDYVFVDEYQDISPLQEDLLGKFTCTMFFVGDVKQSIYGFRMCRPDFFVRKRDSYVPPEGRVIYLNKNFRSGAEIIDCVNLVFKSVMTKDFGGCDYVNEQMITGYPEPACVETYLLKHKDESDPEPKIYSAKQDGKPNDADVVQEVNAVVNKIIDILDKESKGDPENAIAYGNVAVLVRKRSDFTDALIAALRNKSIPVTFVASAGPADEFVTVSSLISMLKLINNTRDEVSLTAVLLSPMFGKFTPAELNELRGDGSFCDCIYGDCNGESYLKAKLREFNAMLNRFIRVAECSTVAELAGQITGECDCFNYAVTLGGEREAAALDAFGEYLAAADPNDLHSVIRHIERVGAPAIKVNDGGNAVKIMTIHASKGLDFKHVILPCLNKEFNFQDTIDTVVCDEREGIVLRSYDMVNRTVKQNPRFAACVKQLRRNTVQEEMRMLYVAMTRAIKGLYLFSYPPAKTRADEDEVSYIDWLFRYLFTDAAVVDNASDNEAATVGGENADKKNLEGLREPNREIVDKLIANFEANKNVKRDSSSVKVTVTEIAHSGDEQDFALTDFGESAAERGTAYHKFMQWADFGNENCYDDLCRKFPSEAAAVDKEQIKLAFIKVNEFIAGRQIARERQFVYSNRGKLIQGVVDLMVFNSDGSVDIVDYKTGAEKSIRNNAAYVRQLDLYAEAVRNVLKLKVNKAYLYSFDGGNFIEVKPNNVQSV